MLLWSGQKLKGPRLNRNSNQSSKPLRVGDYVLSEKLGHGSFGEIYLGKHIETGEEYAIKVERTSSSHPQLHHESRVYQCLKTNQTPGFSDMISYFCDNEFHVLVMDRLGSSLEKLFELCDRKFSLKTILMLADQMISRIQYVHEKLLIHRDIKPDNFLMGRGASSHIVHLIDFGLSKRYASATYKMHIPYREDKSLTGTARYASVKTHLGIEQARRDDMESIGFVLMYFCRGKLPWQGLRAKNKSEKYSLICDKKRSTSMDVLCRGYPEEFAAYLIYCRSLQFEEAPDYEYLKGLFRGLFDRKGYEWDYVYDWDLLDSCKSPQEKTQVDAKVEDTLYDLSGQLEQTKLTPKESLKSREQDKSHIPHVKSASRKKKEKSFLFRTTRG